MRKSEQMFPIIEQWKESKLSKSTFCKQESLSLHVFNYWASQYKKRRKPQAIGDGFIPLELPSDESSSYMEVTLLSGAKINFHRRPNIEELTLIL
ncbi:MAG: hypothetical protein ACJA2S_005317, partial [Cyclobacteriaceae bacterium]